MSLVIRSLAARMVAVGVLYLLPVLAAPLAAGANPANDLCSGVEVISPEALPYETLFDLADFTEPWAGDSTCGYYGSNDGFWSFTPAASGRYRIAFSFDNYQYSPALKIFPGLCDFAQCQWASGVGEGNYDFDWIAGETRTFVLEADASAPQVTSMTLSLLQAAPTNDVCSSPSVIAPDALPFQTTVDLQDYFLDEGADNACGYGGPRDAFWSFQPTVSAKYRFTLSYAPYQYNAYLKVLRGSCGSIQACVLTQEVGTTSVDVALVAGESYIVALEASPVAAQQTTLRVDLQSAAPAGDLCASAIAISPAALPYQDSFNLTDYWIPDAVDNPCNYSGENDKFWTFTPTVAGRYRLRFACDPYAYSSVFKFFRGDCGNLDCVLVEGFGPSYTHDFLFDPGQRYVFVLEAGASGAQETTFELNYVAPVATNDTCASATVIEQGMLPFDTTFDLADYPVNDPGDDPCATWGANDGFWQFTPAIAGLYRFELSCDPYVYGVLLKLIKGGCGFDVCENNMGATPTGSFLYRLSAGTTYLVAIDGSASADQATRFQLSLVTPAPPNETCATAISIAESELPYTGRATFAGTTTNLAFWRFAPSATDLFAGRLAADGSDNSCVNPGDHGCGWTNISPSYYCQGTQVFRADAGTEYYVAISYQNDSALESRVRLERATIELPCGQSVAGALTGQDYPTDFGQRSDLYRWSLDNPETTREMRTVSLTLTPGVAGQYIALYLGRMAEYPTAFWSLSTSDPLQPVVYQDRLPENEYFVAVVTYDTTGDIPYTVVSECGVDPYYIAESAYWRPRRDFGAGGAETAFPLAGLSITPAGRTVNAIAFDLHNVLGIAAGDLSNVRLLQDTNGNGLGDAGDTPVGGAPSISLNGATGSVDFATSFTTGDDLILVGDFANLEPGDELTLRADASTIDVPAGFAKAGSGTVERYAVQGGVENSGGDTRRWTLAYRSPGGRNAAARFSPDGNRIIVAYDSGSAWIFDRAANAPILGLHDHYDSVIYAGYSADGASAITVSADGAVFRWDAQTGAAQSQFTSNLAVTGATPSPDLSRLAVISLGKVQLLDVDARRVLWEFIPGGSSGQPAIANAIAFSPDGTRIVIGASDNRVYMVTAATGQQEYRRTGHTQPVTTVSFTGTGDRFLSASTDATVQVWPTTGGATPLRTISLQGQEALGAAISPDGSRIALVTRAQLRVYNAGTIPPLELFAVPYPNANAYSPSANASPTFTPDGQFIALSIRSVSDPGVYLFQTSDGAYVQSWGTHGGYAGAGPQSRPRLTRDGRRLFVSAFEARKRGDAYSHDYQIWEIPVGNPGAPLRKVPSNQQVFDISDQGSICMDSAGQMFAFDGADFTSLGTTANGSASIVVSPDGGRFLRGDRMFAIPSGAELANYALPDADRTSAFSPDGGSWGFIEGSNVVTLRSDDPYATLYNLTTTSPYQASKILYHPDGVRVGYIQNPGDSNYRGVQFVDMDQDLPVGIYRFPSYSAIADAALSRDGTMLLIGGGNEARLYDMTSGETLRWFYPRNSHLNEMSCQYVDFASSDTQIVIGWDWGYVEVYERSQATGLDLSPDARTLAAGQSQRFSVKVNYEGGATLNVTPSASGGVGNALQATLEVLPPAAATLQGNLLTVNEGAPATFRVRAQYRTGGATLVDESVIAVGDSAPLSLAADPDGFGTNPGSFRDIRYTATWTDGYEEDVTSDVDLSTTFTNEVEIVDNSVRMRAIANPGDYTVTGAFSANGATVRADTVITLYGPQTNWKRLRVTPGGYANDLEFSPDGNQLAVAESSGAVVLYQTQPAPTEFTIHHILDAHRGQVVYAGFVDNGLLVTASDDGTVKLWSDGNGYTSPTLQFTHTAPITAARRHGNFLAFGDSQGTIGLLDLESFQSVWVVARHQAKVRCVDLDDNVVLSGGDDAHAFATSTLNGAALRSFTFISEPVLSVGFWNPDVYFVLAADRTLTQVRASDHEVLRRYEYDLPLTRAEAIGDEVYVTSAQPTGAFVYNQEGLLLRWLDLSPGGDIVSLALDPTYNLLLTGRKGTSSSFQFWEAGRGLFRGDLEHSFPLGSAFAVGDGSRIYTQSAKRTLLFDATGPVATNRPLIETGYFLPFNFRGFDVSEAANLFATNFGTNAILVFNSATNLLYRTLQNPEVPTAWSISPAGDRMAVADSKIRLWDLAALSLVNEESRSVAAIDMFLTHETTPRTFYAGVTSNFLGLWNSSGLLENGTVLPAGTAFDVRVSPDGTRVIVFRQVWGYCYSAVYLDFYDISVIQLEPAFLGSRYLFAWPCWGPQAVPRAAFSGDGQLVLAGIGNYAVPAQLINLADGSVIHEFNPPSAIQGEASGVADVQFVDNDRAAMIAWNEGYAEVLRRLNVQTLALDINLAGRSILGKDGLTRRDVLTNLDRLPTDAEVVERAALATADETVVDVHPGDVLQALSVAGFDDGSLVNVTASIRLVSSQPGWVEIVGSRVTIQPTAPLGGVFTLVARYTDYDKTVDSNPITVRILGGNNEPPEGWIVK